MQSSKRNTKNAKLLRNNPTEPEKRLWYHLKNDQLGVRFRRQLSLGPYIADFVCPKKKIIIEIDGEDHVKSQDYDQKRTQFFSSKGYKVIRFWNNDVINNIGGVVTHIVQKLDLDEVETQDGAQTIELINTPEIKSSTLDKMRVRKSGALKGNIRISGAKNAALKHMCAALLTDEPMQFTNMPVGLGDVRTLAQCLNHLGMRVALRSDGVAILYAKEITNHVAPYDLVRKMRASVLVLGPLLARHGHAEVSLPGGCALGTRPVDLHINGLKAMGAEIEIEQGYIKAEASNGLIGAEITFPKVSVGATENLMMAATLAKGKTVLKNAAKEPEIIDQGEALIAMGAKIEGLGTSEVTIEGAPKLHGATHSVIPDRIETGTYMCAVGLCGGEVRLENTRMDFLSSLIAPLQEAGMEIWQDGDDVVVKRNGAKIKGVDLMTDPYPGFPTDLQAQFMTMLTLCDGAGMINETIFENRFMHVPELNRMGADIRVQGNAAIIRGVNQLHGAEVMATDLRASVSLILAGLVADGETLVNRIYHLDRGYENIVEKLTAVGANVERVSG